MFYIENVSLQLHDVIMISFVFSSCTSETKAISSTKSEDVGDFVTTSDCEGWDAIRDPILMLLGIFCGFLCIVCTFLITKIMQLKKRPRYAYIHALKVLIIGLFIS